MGRKLTERRLARLVQAVRRRAGEDAAPTLAAALTYRAFLSLFPLVLLALSVIGFLLAGDPAAREEWTRRLTGEVPGLAELVGRNVDALVGGRAGTGALGLVGVVWSASGVAHAARYALARVFRTGARGPVRERTRSLATVLKIAGSLVAVGIIARARALYGTVGALFGLLAILNLAAQLFVWGAELSAVLADRRRSPPSAGC